MVLLPKKGGSIMSTKICIKCGVEKGMDDFYDAKGKNIKIPKKINTCKVCVHRITHDRTKAHYDERKKKHAEYLDNHPSEKKECRICFKRLPLKDFVFHATKADLMSNDCRKCRLDMTKKRISKNKYLVSGIDKTAKKVCKKCGIEKQITDYNLHLGNSDLHRHECKQCQKVNASAHHQLVKEKEKPRRKEYYENNKKSAHGAHLKKKFNIDRVEYEEILKKQNGKCAICGTDKPGGKYLNFPVDHDHATGKIRALLCSPCNTGMGHFKDSPTLLRKAAEYLDSFNNSI